MKKFLLFSILLIATRSQAQQMTIKLLDSAEGLRKVEMPTLPIEIWEKFKLPEGLTSFKTFEYHADYNQFLFSQRKAVDTMTNKVRKQALLEILQKDSSVYYNGSTKESIRLLSAYNREGKRLIYVDTDNDMDFTDEKGYDTSTLRSLDDKADRFLRVTNLEYFDPTLKQLKAMEAWIFPVPFKKTYDITDSLHHLEIVLGNPPKLAPLDSNHYFIIYNYGHTPVYEKENCLYEIGTKFKGQEWHIELTKDGKSVNLGEWNYEVMNLDMYGDQVTLSKTLVFDKPKDHYQEPIPGSDVVTGMAVNTKGKFVILDFWGTWCAPCKAITPELKKLHSSLDSSKFMILGIAFDGDSRKVIKYIKDNNIKWPNHHSPGR